MKIAFLVAIFLVIIVAIALLGCGIWYLVSEHLNRGSPGSAPQRHSVRIPITGLELASGRLSLVLIALSALLLWICVPTALSLLDNKEETSQEVVANGRRELERLLPTGQRPRWNVSLSSCLMLPEQHDRLDHFLQGLSFSSIATRSHRFTRRNDRLAPADTVFYYTSTNAEIAQTLVRMLNAEFGRQFVAARGDGIGVPQARVQTMLVIHRIGEDCRTQA